MITKRQLYKTEKWLYANARSIEIAKWNLLFDEGTAADLVAEMVKYQNTDGGFGSGFEADILTPESAAIPSAEAIFMAQDFRLDLSGDWANELLAWFEDTATDTPSFWEGAPPSVEDYPHPPWWNYSPDTSFTPNPCAVVSSAMLIYGSDSQKLLGEAVAKRCVDFILTHKDYGDHDTYCLQRLYLALVQTKSPLLTREVSEAMNQRVKQCVCIDSSKWMEYVAQPLDIIDSPKSCWYDLLADAIPANLDYWEKNITDDGYWSPNFSWGVDTDASRSATKNWQGYMAVKRIKILKSFGRIEE